MALTIRSDSSETTEKIGEIIGSRLRRGDLVLLHGDLGAGKTTFTKGLARGMEVEGRIISPTFIVARVHESLVGGPDLIHVDAYRIEDDLDLETLDLDTSLSQSVTVIEWGYGKAEVLSDSRLEISLEARPVVIESSVTGNEWEYIAEEPRVLRLDAIGSDWQQRLDNDLNPALKNFS